MMFADDASAGGKRYITVANTQKNTNPHVWMSLNRGIHFFGSNRLDQTIATLFAIPQIALFGWLLTIIGFPLTLMSCGVVSALGVAFIIHGFKHDRPIIDEETWGNGTPKEEVPAADDLTEEEVLSEVEAISLVDE